MDKRVREILESAIASNVRALLEDIKKECAVEIVDALTKTLADNTSDRVYTLTTLSDDELDKATYECMSKIIDHIEHWEKTKQIERIEGLGGEK